MKMLINVYLLFANFQWIISVTFEKDPSFINVLCDGTYLGQARSATECAGFCDITPSCKSFFFVKPEQICKGCDIIYGSKTGCSYKMASVYYKTTDLTTTTTTRTTTSTTATPTTSSNPTSTTTATTTGTTTTQTTTSTTASPTTSSTAATPPTTSTPTSTTTTTTTGTTTTSTTTSTPITTTTTTTTRTTSTTTIPPTVRYNDPCTTDTECSTLSLTNCLQGTCQCIAGYSYNPGTDGCVEDCSTNGDTYIYYPNMALNIQHITEQSGGSFEDCKNLCTSLSQCRGFNYCPACDPTSLCRVKRKTPLTNPHDYFGMPSTHYYFRNCA